MSGKMVLRSLPVLHIKAKSNYNVGFQIGRTFKHFIQEHTTTKTSQILHTFYRTSEGRQLYDTSVETAKKCYPHIVEEIKGLSDASGVSFEMLFLQSMVSEILFYYTNPMIRHSRKEEPKEIAGCSDVIVNHAECRVLAHNEDWGTEVESMMFLIDVELDKTTAEADDSAKENGAKPVNERISGRSERYLSLMFPGYLAGNTFYVSKHFAVTVDSLVPQTAKHGAVPVDILLRAMIGCETIEECVSVMKNDPIGCSYGINVNIASRHTMDMWSLEVYPNKGETYVDVKQIGFSKGVTRETYYVHTNHYKHIDGVAEVSILEGSKAREATANKMEVPRSVQDVCKILGDTSSSVEPIYRSPGTSLYDIDVETLATAVFDMKQEVLHVYLQNPNSSLKPFLTIPFVN